MASTNKPNKDQCKFTDVSEFPGIWRPTVVTY